MERNGDEQRETAVNWPAGKRLVVQSTRALRPLKHGIWRLSRRVKQALTPQRRTTLLLTTPLSVVALGIGFYAQSFSQSTPALNAQVMEALLPASTTGEATEPASEDSRLGAIEARRAQQPPTPAVLPEAPASLVEPAAGRPVPLEVRVALLRQAGQPSFMATGPWWLRNGSGQVLAQGQARSPVDLSAGAGANDLWLDTTPGEALLVNGQPYSGRLRLLAERGGITPINHLPLEAYIASVVGAEMPTSWSMEALKAQAVAARSYALAHMARPAHKFWHLGDTTRWQAYRGLTTVNVRTTEAAARTSGLILSYQGGIVESLYAANSQITLEAHGHLGASMSQEGAQQLALAGRKYNEILGHYYRGASLARLQIGGAN